MFICVIGLVTQAVWPIEFVFIIKIYKHDISMRAHKPVQYSLIDTLRCCWSTNNEMLNMFKSLWSIDFRLFFVVKVH